jgi:hypothetical protein
MQNRRAAISRRFRFNQPRRRCDSRPRGGSFRRGLVGPFRLRNGRPAADNAAAGTLAGRILVRAQRPEPPTGEAQDGRNDAVEDAPDAGGHDVQNEGGETALSESGMPPRYGPARIGGSR